MKKVILGFCFMLSCSVSCQTTNDKKEASPFALNSDFLELKEYISPLTFNAPRFKPEFEVKPLKEKEVKNSMPIYEIQVLDPKMKTELPEDLPKQSLQIIKPTGV